MVIEGQLYRVKSTNRFFLVQEKLSEELSYTVTFNDGKKSEIIKISLWTIYYSDTHQTEELFESQIELHELVS